ncbi:Retrovirus-related Pol polyprotein from transposon TNT 1-94 [Glycine soja]
MIRLALTLEIKHNMLKEITPKALLEKLKNIYVSKSLTNRLCLKESYQLKMETEGNLHDHINNQLLNVNDKLSDKEQTLLLLASLPRSFKVWVQSLLVRRSTLKIDEKNERMMRAENVNDEHHALVVVESERGGNHSRRHDMPRGRSKSQSHLQRDMSNMQCYYCSENRHLQVRCKKMRDDLRKLRDINKDGANSQANVVKSVEHEDYVFLTTNDEVAKTKWVMDFAASKHICRDQEMFDTLKTDGEFSHFKSVGRYFRWRESLFTFKLIE